MERKEKREGLDSSAERVPRRSGRVWTRVLRDRVPRRSGEESGPWRSGRVYSQVLKGRRGSGVARSWPNSQGDDKGVYMHSSSQT